MKNIIILSILCLTIVSPLMSQVVVTGHITAEIVDAASISSASVNEMEFTRSQDSDEQENDEPVLLGEFLVHSGTDVAWDVVIKPASLTVFSGESLTLDTSLERSAANAGETPGNQQKDADQTLLLNGNVNILREQPSGLYQGSYTVILAYN
ncbi:MAG TPA: hypothetical protein PLM86_07465 [Bacteroidales bacterium]|nr:MAG: hypothetical protein BWX93_00248 [Bacteroidetes bacterium ADurb.Bin139]HOG26008.1 hypothetical protein [Bacteroidales bacterium]HOR11375.1 hypothetical protein [Bacteroidales bacterium]HPB77103.1 hypothetical protein [Bacteroidales bacterium]HPK39737.1 hypothetical protein [Bacteroidales bacterium]